MDTYPIASLIEGRRRDLRISSAEIVRRAGYKSINSGLRRIQDLCHGDLSARTKFLLAGLPAALELPADDIARAIQATADQLAEEEKARLEEEDRRYRERFRAHVIWVTERERPSSIIMAAFAGIPRLLRFDLDRDRGEETYVAQAKAAMPSTVDFFGKATGFIINFTPACATQYDPEGNVLATFSKAQRLPDVDVTLKGDSRSILPLFGVKPPEPYER